MQASVLYYKNSLKNTPLHSETKLGNSTISLITRYSTRNRGVHYGYRKKYCQNLQIIAAAKTRNGRWFSGQHHQRGMRHQLYLSARSRLRAIGSQWRGKNHRIAHDCHHAQTHFGQHICRGIRHGNTKSSRTRKPRLSYRQHGLVRSPDPQ